MYSHEIRHMSFRGPGITLNKPNTPLIYIIVMQMQFSMDTWPRKHMTAVKLKQWCVSSINFFTQIKQNKTNIHLKIYHSVMKQNKQKPEDHWSCIAHLSAEDMLN